jgi:hypothetical protein
MEKSSKRGKIPQTDWPLIMARYEAGETLSSIARSYDCSPPAISYIVNRNREKPANGVSPPSAVEPQLIKALAHAGATDSAGMDKPLVVPRTPAPVAEIRHEPPSEARAATPINGDQRRTLSLFPGNGSGNGNGHGTEPPLAQRPSLPSVTPPRPAPPQGAGERIGQHPFQAPPRNSAGFDSSRNGRDLFAAPEGRPMAQAPREGSDVTRGKDNGAFIDQELRSRVDGDIAVFLAAFDAALAADTQESRFGLREATDRLLRAGARTRIELERLEARVPLPPKDGAAEPDRAAWRYR